MNFRNGTAGKATGSQTDRRVGRPSLGERVVVKGALDRDELAVIDVMRGDLERSAFLGVVLTEHVGRPDLLPHPDQLELVDTLLLSKPTVQRLLDEARSQPAPPPPRRRRVREARPDATVRVHPDVRTELERRRDGLPLCHYNAEVIRERLGFASRVDRTEVLPLAM